MQKKSCEWRLGTRLHREWEPGCEGNSTSDAHLQMCNVNITEVNRQNRMARNAVFSLLLLGHAHCAPSSACGLGVLATHTNTAKKKEAASDGTPPQGLAILPSFLGYSSPFLTRASFRGGEGRGAFTPHLGNFVPPLWDFNPSKLNTAHYTHVPQTSSDVLLPPPPLPPLGIFLTEPLLTPSSV